MAYMWWRSGLTGGGADDLDGIDGDQITAGDLCLVPDTTNKFIRFYVATDPIGVGESSPEIILPDDNPGTKGWKLYRCFSSGMFNDSIDLSTSLPTVSGDNSVAFGDSLNVQGDNCFIGGGMNNVIIESGGDSYFSGIIAGYANNITDSPMAFIGGGESNYISASADYAAIIGGCDSLAHLTGMQAHANGSFTADGDAQWGRLKLRHYTTDATQTEIFLDGNSARPVLPASRSWAFSIRLIARQVSGGAGTVGDSAFWNITGGIKRDGSNNTTLIGTPQGTGTPGANDRDAGAAAWDVSVTADDANESLCVKVTGEVNKTVHWSASIELEQVG